MIVNEENTHHDPKTLSILNSVQLSRCGCLREGRVWTDTQLTGLRSGRDSRAGARAPAPRELQGPCFNASLSAANATVRHGRFACVREAYGAFHSVVSTQRSQTILISGESPGRGA